MEVRGMMVSKHKPYFNSGDPLTRLNKGDEEKQGVDDESAIPLRYQDGLGGIDIEKVQREQRQAKQQFIRAILRYLFRHR
jgi:allophanate hydrolase subunit 1